MFDHDRLSRLPDGADATPAPVEARSSARLNLLIRPAKLVSAAGEFLCVLRDVSSGGCKVRLFHPLPMNGAMMLELGNGDCYEVEPVWERDDHAGLRFASPVPVEYLINEDGRFRKRPVRLRLTRDALVVAGREALPARMRDLSQQGAQVECSGRLAVDQQVRLEVAGLSPIVSKVRWRREAAPATMAVGLVFEQTFKLDELARIALALQTKQPSPGRPATR